MQSGLLQRIHLLYQQSRYEEARSLLEGHLEQYPEDGQAQYFLAGILLNLGEKKQSRALIEQLLAKDAESPDIVTLAVNMELIDEKYDKAESIAGQLLRMVPESSEAHLMMARVKWGQRNYDRALHAVDKALSLDPENVEALNMKINIGGLLGNTDTNETIAEALNLNPESAATIANQGVQLVREGKIDEALERLKYALSLEPTNQLARYGMIEALKARFWPYRLFFKYKQAMAKLSGGGSWAFIIGAYIALQFIRSWSDTYPQLVPVVYVIIGLFLLTWVMDPLMNLYLLSNKYGRLLLDDDDKTMAKLCGGSLTLAILCVAAYIGWGMDHLLFMAALFLLFMIPLGTFLNSVVPKNRKMLGLFTGGIVLTGVVGAILNISALLTVSLIGIFIYQWVINGILIKENSRTFG